jgi:hypothetical protein
MNRLSMPVPPECKPDGGEAPLPTKTELRRGALTPPKHALPSSPLPTGSEEEAFLFDALPEAGATSDGSE